MKRTPKRNSRRPRYQAVQWFSSAEWRGAHELLHGPGSDAASRRAALQTLLAWKARDPYLPAGLESTLGLLEVELQRDAPERALRLMYAAALMRFVNHTLDDAQSRSKTLFQAAEALDIPQWVIDLRHETAHGHDLPALELLRNAARFALDWLRRAYWEPKARTIADFRIMPKSPTFHDEINALVSLYGSLVMCAHPSFGIRHIGDIPDKRLKRDLAEDLAALLKSDQITKQTSLAEARRTLLEALNCFVEENRYAADFDKVFAETLAGADSTFMDDNLAKLDDWATLWEPLLSLMHERHLISALVGELLEIVNDSNCSNKRRKCAAVWVKEILNGLNKCNVFKKIIISKTNDLERTLTELVPVITQRIRDETDGLTLNVCQNIPEDISNVEFVRNALKNFTPFLHIYSKELIEICNPKIPLETSQKLLAVITIMTDRCKSNIDSSFTVKTVDDLKTVAQQSNSNRLERNSDGIDQSGIWKVYSGQCDWETCPIGILPWQNL